MYVYTIHVAMLSKCIMTWLCTIHVCVYDIHTDIYICIHIRICTYVYTYIYVYMYPYSYYGVATISRSLKITGLFCKEPCKRDDFLQKRRIILWSLLIVATPYIHTSIYTNSSCALYIRACMCIHTYVSVFIQAHRDSKIAIHTYVNTCVFAWIQINIHKYICTHICIQAHENSNHERKSNDDKDERVISADAHINTRICSWRICKHTHM